MKFSVPEGVATSTNGERANKKKRDVPQCNLNELKKNIHHDRKRERFARSYASEI
jgi:hypothetical protein